MTGALASFWGALKVGALGVGITRTSCAQYPKWGAHSRILASGRTASGMYMNFPIPMWAATFRPEVVTSQTIADILATIAKPDLESYLPSGLCTRSRTSIALHPVYREKGEISHHVIWHGYQFSSIPSGGKNMERSTTTLCWRNCRSQEIPDPPPAG